jgi:hypothetical protein
MSSQQSKPDSLDSLKVSHSAQLADMMRREVNKLVLSLIIPQGIEVAVEVATGLERKPILVRVLEEAVTKLKSGEIR